MYINMLNGQVGGQYHEHICEGRNGQRTRIGVFWEIKEL